MFTRLQQVLFTEDKTSEEDYLRHLIRWLIVLYQNNLQRNIFKFFLVILCLYNIGFLVYIYFSKCGITEIMDMLPAQILTHEIQMIFIHILTISSRFGKGIGSMTSLLKRRRQSNKAVKDHIRKEVEATTFLRNISLSLSLFVFILNMPWNMNNSITLFGFKINRKYFGSNIFLDIFFFMTCAYCSFFGISIFFVSQYGCCHVKIQLYILIEKWIKFNKYCSDTNENSQNDSIYQSMIQSELRSFWIHFLEIKWMNNQISELTYWPLLTVFTHTPLVLGSTAVGILMRGSVESYGMIAFWFFILFQSILNTETGQQLQSESEKLYDTVKSCCWSGWNKSNKNFLMMFLISTKEPIVITSSVLEQNRIMSMKVLKGLYTIVAFYRSIKN